jgi:hypothetical protein
MQCETDGLGGGRIQAQPWAIDRDSRPDKICKMRKLGAHQFFDIDTLPPIPIVRVGDVPVRRGREFIGRIAEHAAQHFVDPKQPTVKRDMSKTDWCILERDPELRLAVGESAPGLDLVSNYLGE